MRPKKQKRTSWAAQYANESDYRKQLSGFRAQHMQNMSDILASEQRSKNIQDEILEAQKRRFIRDHEAERSYNERRENAKEIKDVLDAVRPATSVLRKIVESASPAAPFTNMLPDTTDIIPMLYTLGGDVAAVQKGNMPDQPVGYGITDFFKDQWNSFFGELNSLQADSARGYQTMSMNDRNLIDSYMKSLDARDEIDSIQEKLQNLQLQLDSGKLSEDQLREINGEVTQLVNRRSELTDLWNSLEGDRKQLEDTAKQGILGQSYDEMVAGNGWKWAEPVVGKITAGHNELNDARRYLSNLSTAKPNRDRTRTNLKLALEKYDELGKEWQAVVDENDKDAQYHKNRVTPWFKANEEIAGTDFFDPATYMFKMPGILGGSASSYMKQGAAMVAALVGAPIGGWAALGAAGVALYNNYGAGVDENAAEVSTNIRDSIVKKSGLSEEEVNDIFAGKSTNQKNIRKVAEAIKWSENLFRSDMAATTWDAVINTALETVPLGKGLEFTKLLKGSRAYRKVMVSQPMRKIIRSKLGDDLVRGWNVGSVVSPVVGAGAAVANATLGRGARAVGNLVVREIDNSTAGSLISKIRGELSNMGRTASRINPAEVELRRAARNGTRSKYIKGIGGRLITSSILEGIEEGKQHINAEMYKNGQLDGKVMDTFDIALTDAVNGITSGSYILGIPLDGLGIIRLKDKELLQEIKGGMLGGWGHTATVNVLQNVVPYMREQSANEIAIEAALSQKAESLYKFNQYTNFAKKGLFAPSYRNVVDAFERLKTLNESYKDSHLGTYGISPELIEEGKKSYDLVVSIAQDPLTRAEAAAQGIIKREWRNPKSQPWRSNKEYHEYVALKAVGTEKLKETRGNLKEAAEELNKVQTRIKARLAPNEDGRQELLEYLQAKDEPETIESDRRKGLDQLVDSIITEGEHDYGMVNTIAQLAALLKYRDQIETGIEAQKENPNAKVRRGLKSQLDRINKMIDDLIEANEAIVKSFGIDVGNGMAIYTNANQSIRTLQDVEDHLVYRKAEHDELVDAYLEYIKWQNEYDSAVQDYENLTGKLQRIGEDGKARDLTNEDREWDPRSNLDEVSYTKGNARKVLKEVHEMQDDDDAFESAIEQVFQEDLQAQHLEDENAFESPEFTPNLRPKRPVLDGNGDQIQVEFNENGMPKRRLAPNEFFDTAGLLWEYTDGSDALHTAMKNVGRTKDSDELWEERVFRETWNALNDKPLPLTKTSILALQNRSLSKTATASTTQPPADKKPLDDIKEKTPQQETIELLEHKYAEDHTKVLDDYTQPYHTTSQDYFIMQDGKVVRMSRVHNILPESYVHEDQRKVAKEILDKLKAASTIDEIEKIVESYRESRGDFDIAPYIQYLKDNESIFFNNPTYENAKELSIVLDHISAAISSHRTPSAAIRMGNLIDDLTRLFFGNRVFFDLTSTEEGIKQLFDQSAEGPEGRTYSELFQSYDAFKSLINQLRSKYQYYTEKLGWELVTYPLTWRTKFNSFGWVAGQTDMIGVDKDGRIHIIDFKTSRHSFETDAHVDIALTEEYRSVLGSLSEDDFKNGRLSKNARNILRNIKNNSNRSNITLKWTDGGAIVVSKQNKFFSKPNAIYGQRLSAFNDYTNQQTTYAQMIQLETGGNVASIEILPFYCSYDREFRTIYSVESQDRIPLMFSSKMLEILNGVSDRNEQVLSQIMQDYAANIETLGRAYDRLADILEDYFDDLSDATKLQITDFLNGARYHIEGQLDIADIDEATAAVTETNALLKEASDGLNNAKIDIANTAERAAQQKINEANKGNEPGDIIDSPPIDGIPPEINEGDAGDATGSTYAKNKKDSAGNTSHTNLNYRQIDADPELAKATSAPDFVTNGVFELYVDGDDVYCDISYGGKQRKRIKIDTKYNNTRFPKGKSLFEKVKALQDQLSDGQRIVPVRATMYRTNGRIKLAVDGNGRYVYNNVTDTDLFANEDIYDIEFSKNYGVLGFMDKGVTRTFDETESSRPVIYNRWNPRMTPADGTLIFLKKVHHNETNSDAIIPVSIDRIKLTEGDAQFIVKLLLNPSLLDREYITEVDGEVKNLHATGRQLANMLFTIVDSPAEVGGYLQILRDSTRPGVIKILSRQNIATNTEGLGEFDLTNQNDLTRFITTLKGLSIAERHDVLLARLGKDSTKEIPFGGIREFFKENSSVKTVSVSPSLSFDFDDFKTIRSKTGATRSGVSGFGFYLKHGMLRTQYAELGSTNVEINDVIIEDAGTPTMQSNGIELPAPVPETPTEVIIEDSFDGGDLFKTRQSGKREKPLSAESARAHIRRLLGDVPIEFEEGFIKVLSGTPGVVGTCRADAIILSSTELYAGVEYHESFHRVFETLIPEERRDRIYKKIAKRLGLNLYNEDGTENKQAFRQVAEYAADKYMDYMNGYMEQEDAKYPWFAKAFNTIRDWITPWVKFRSRDLYKVMSELNRGKYRNAKPSQASIDRFNRLYKDLYCQIHGVDMANIIDREMYDKLRKSVKFFIMFGQNIDPSGRNIQQIGKHIDKATFRAGVDKFNKINPNHDAFGEKPGTIPTIGQLALKEIYDNFDNEFFRDDIAADISYLATDYQKIQEDESVQDAQGEDVKAASIGEHTRSSYEFSRFDKATTRVKFFFSTIADMNYETTVDTDPNTGAKRVVKREVFALNEFGLPEYVPFEYVVNDFLNSCHDIDTVDELLARLQHYAVSDPMYNRMYQRIKHVWNNIYKPNESGTSLVRNSDNEALFAQIMNFIRSNKHAFDIARSQSVDGEFGKHSIKIQTTDADYNATFYPNQWNNILVYGGTPILKISKTGTLEFNSRLKNSQLIFGAIAKMFSHVPKDRQAENGYTYKDVGIKEWLENIDSLDPDKTYFLRLKVGQKVGYYNNPKDPSQIEVVKDKIVEALNMLGIQINSEEFNYMLRSKYGSTDYSALAKMFNSTDITDSMSSFINFLSTVTAGGVLQQEIIISGKPVPLSKAYSKIAFIRELANWKYQYRHSHDQLTVLATGNNKFYSISDNNYISDVTRYINKRTKEFDEIKNDPYNFYESEEDALGEKQTYGSLVIETISEDPNSSITVRNFVGFKTDKRGDTGSDYFDISRREDYVSKATILEKGGIIMPTLSDKKTYMYLDGISLPGLDYGSPTSLGSQIVISKDPTSQLYYMLSQDEKVIDRFISYAMSEYMSIKKAIADIDNMSDEERAEDVANFYTKSQGARFSSLLGVWVNDYKTQPDGSQIIVGETYHSFSNGNKTPKENLKEAEKYFFNLSKEEQRVLISKNLHKILLKEIKECVNLGLIEKVGDSDNLFQNYANVGLNASAIQAIYNSIASKHEGVLDKVSSDRYKSLATIIYINDISNKAIMSGQEVERLFSGNPSFYKWNFDDNGNLIDRTVDELKRLGGLVSTGNNNFLELKDIPVKYQNADGSFSGMYKCAQVSDEVVGSPQTSLLEETMLLGELRTALYIQKESELQIDDSDVEKADYNEANREMIAQRIDKMSIDELKAELDPKTLSIVERKAKESSDSFKGDIDVNDGSAYISDTMAEMLLRMNGNYSSVIEEAFKILREEKVSTALEKQSAYQKIITEVIGSQKYTAFGRRTHAKTGIQVAYYNKMALFPLFKCICTGKTRNVFDKMNEQGIDMLLVDSAVKVGSQGSRNINWDSYRQSEDENDPVNHVGEDINAPLKPIFEDSFEFITYDQKFAYLRKQLNTDPTEDVSMNIGTQMTKIAMVNLLDGRTYYHHDGKTVISGTELRDDIMNILNELSNRGLKSIHKRFFKTNKDGQFVDNSGNVLPEDARKVIDERKFASEMKSLMMTKDPDKNIMDALELVPQENTDGTTSYHLRLPLNAVSNSKWMESVLISGINKKVVDVETPGAAFIQRSVWGMEGGQMFSRKKGQIIGDTAQDLYNGKRLQMINEEGSMDCVVSVDFIKKMFKGELPRVPIKDKNRNVVWDLIPKTDSSGNPIKDKDGKTVYVEKRDKDGNPVLDKNGHVVYKRKIRTREMTFDELRNWLINRGIIGEKATTNIVGYRIPTQAQSSIHALRIVDIIPAVNDTIILPAEFTKITGSDKNINVRTIKNSFNCWKPLT